MCMCKNNHSTSLEAFEDWSLHAKSIFIYDPYLLLGGIRSLSQSQEFAFCPPDSLCAQSILSLSELGLSHTGKAPDNTSGPRTMVCTFEGLVFVPIRDVHAYLTPAGVQTARAWRGRYTVNPSGLPVMEHWCILGGGWKMWVCSSAFQCHYRFLQNSVPAVTGVGYWLWGSPCQKTNTKCFPENYLTKFLQHLNSVVLLCYLYKTAFGGIYLIKCK